MDSEKLWIEMIHRMSRTEQAVNIRKLAKELNISPQEIQRLIHSHEAEQRDYGFHWICRLGKVQLIVDRLDLFTQLNLIEPEMADENQMRIDAILTTLIQKKDYVRIEDLAAELYVSRATIDRLMKHIKLTAQEYGLQVVSRPKYGIMLIGNEVAKRLCFAHHYAKKVNKPKDDVIVEQVQRILWQVMKKYQLHLNDINFYNLSYHCVIALRRIVGGNQVPQPLLLEQTEGMEREWQAAQEIVACFEEEFSIHVEMNETQYIMMHLLGKRIIENDQNISQEVWECVEEVIKRIWQVKQIDFREDADLKTVLALHFQPMLTRLRYNLPQSNPLLSQIKRDMSPGYELALCAAEVLENQYHLSMDENEAGFLALHFALALEKKKNFVRSRKIAIVCASGRGTARLIQYKMMQRYQYQEENMTLVSLFDLKTLDPEVFSCILSTVPINESLSIPIVYVDLTMDETSLRKVSPYITAESAETAYVPIQVSLIFLNMEMKDKEEALTFLCN
uniref:BglG family transcription antiterminator n=1 Tax=Holdemania filiformis TaxID=61171 RepID=UPI00248EC71B